MVFAGRSGGWSRPLRR